MVSVATIARRRSKQSAELAKRLRAIGNAVPDAVTRVARDVFIAATNGIVTGTPVDRGRLRAGWNPSVGEEDTAVPPDTDNGHAEANAIIARAEQVAAGSPQFPKLLLTNAVEYAAIIETGGFQPPNPGPSKDPRPGRKGFVLVQGGFSTKAPEGMLIKGLFAARARVKDYESALANAIRSRRLR